MGSLGNERKGLVDYALFGCPMINALVFDVDGVLVENKVFASMLEREYGISREMTAPFFHGPFEDCVLGRAELREALPEYLVKWKWPGSLDEFIRTWFAADAQVNQPMLEFISRMRGRRAALLYRQHARGQSRRLPGKAAGPRQGCSRGAFSRAGWAVRSRRSVSTTGSWLRRVWPPASCYSWMISSRTWRAPGKRGGMRSFTGGGWIWAR